MSDAAPYAREFPVGLVSHVRKFLGNDGIAFFVNCKLEYDTVSPVIVDGPIPHPVHLREGMQVRNAMRKSELCSTWTDHDFDNNWAEVVNQVIKKEMI